MKKANHRKPFFISLFLLSSLLFSACFGGIAIGEKKADLESSIEELKNLHEISFEGDELTIHLGTNKSTGCEWKTKPQNDKVIDYSINRVFKLSDAGALSGEAVGTLNAGFKGKGAGTADIVCTTPVNWDGTGNGYTYTVTVKVNQDGTIDSASGKFEETDGMTQDEDTATDEETEDIVGNGNYPYEPDTPAPTAHEGTFVSDHGKMVFDGDGESIVIDFDDELSEWTGLPAGEHEGKYAFLSGNLPPNGSFPIRYDAAHEMQITVNGTSAVMDAGIASEDGSSGQVGVNVVKPESIPLLFDDGDKFFSVVFVKE